MSPVERTLKFIREQGGFPWMVERYIHQRKLKIDFLHIIDLLALSRHGVEGWQVCGSDFAAHKAKIMEEHRDNTVKWLETPGTKLFLIGWRRVKLKRGGKAMRWEPRLARLTLEDGEILFTELKD